jgi:hypothetical protein
MWTYQELYGNWSEKYTLHYSYSYDELEIVLKKKKKFKDKEKEEDEEEKICFSWISIRIVSIKWFA